MTDAARHHGRDSKPREEPQPLTDAELGSIANRTCDSTVGQPERLTIEFLVSSYVGLRDAGGWREIASVPIGRHVMVIWLDGDDYEGPEEASFTSPDAYWGSTSNLRKKGEGMAWPTHWAERPQPPITGSDAG